MKKLMIALAAAATTMFSFGAGTETAVNRETLVNDFGGWTGTSFEAEAFSVGPKNVGDIVGKDDTGNQEGENKFWYSAAPETDELGAITNGNGVAGADVSRPDAFAEQNLANTKALQIDTTSPLFRTVLPNSRGVQPVDIGDGIYLDTLVKFTAADEAFGTNALESVDKIAIEYVEREADEANGISALTNFVVRAGFIGSELFATNYAVALPDGWIENNKKDAWHRLTVRALTNIDGNNRVGFKIYLDKNVLTYVTDNNEFAQSSGITDETHTIFPSAVETDENNYSDISSVAFSGNGSIDDVVFTTTKPKFIAESEAVVVPFVADAGVTEISVAVSGAVVTNIDVTAAGTYTATLEAQTTAFTVDVTVDESNGYTFGSMTVGDAVYDTNPASVTGYTGGDITITTKRNNFNLFDANGDPISGTFQKLSEVLETEGVAKIVLAHNYDVAESEGDGFVTYDIDNDITLDLNGNTITGGGDDALFTINSGTTTMIVIDSSAANTGKIDYTGTYAVFYSAGDVVIGALTGDYGPSIDGYLAAAEDDGDGVWLVKGKIEAATNSDEGEFLWDGYFGNPTGTITAAAELDSDEGYWVVTPQGGSEPKEIAVPTAIEGLVYNKGEQTGVLAGEGYTLTGNVGTNAAGYTAVATLETGYAWVGGSTDPTNIVWYIGMKGVTPTIVMDPTSATFDSNKTNVADYVTSVVAYDGEDLLTENLDYYVSGLTEKVTGAGEYKVWVIQKAWSEGQNYIITNSQYATLTITAGGEYPTYIDGIEDATAKAAYETKYDTWKTTYGADTSSEHEAAFLLNIAQDAADQTLEPVSITMEGGKVVISANQTLTAVNGKVYVKVATTLAGLATAEWTEATLDEGKVQVTPGSSDTAGFYKIKVDF